MRPGGNTSVGAEGITERLEDIGVYVTGLAADDGPTLAHCEITRGSHVKAMHSEHQEHVSGAASDTPEPGELSANS